MVHGLFCCDKNFERREIYQRGKSPEIAGAASIGIPPPGIPDINPCPQLFAGDRQNPPQPYAKPAFTISAENRARLCDYEFGGMFGSGAGQGDCVSAD